MIKSHPVCLGNQLCSLWGTHTLIIETGHCKVQTEAEATVEHRGRNTIQHHQMEALQQIKLTVGFVYVWKASDKRSLAVSRDTPRADITWHTPRWGRKESRSSSLTEQLNIEHTYITELYNHVPVLRRTKLTLWSLRVWHPVLRRSRGYWKLS